MLIIIPEIIRAREERVRKKLEQNPFYVLRQITEKRINKNKLIHIGFIDLKKCSIKLEEEIYDS